MPLREFEQRMDPRCTRTIFRRQIVYWWKGKEGRRDRDRKDERAGVWPGSQTFNTVFGATRNPHDLTKTCGGSTGGGAVAAACGMVPLADGSDYGGSLRNPPNFCGVVGLRPSPGRVPNTPADLAWQPFSVAEAWRET